MNNIINVNGMTSYYSNFIKSVTSQISVDKGSKVDSGTVTGEKRSKKAQREYHTKQRRTWGELNPVTRSVPSGKTYNRKKEKQRLLRASGTCSVTTEAKRRPARNSEMDLMPIFFCKLYIFCLTMT